MLFLLSTCTTTTTYIHNDSQIAIHPVHRSGRELSNGPFAIILNGDQTFRKPDFEFPSGSEGIRIRRPVTIKILNWLRRGFGKLAGEAAADELFGGFEIWALVCGDVEAGENTFVVLEDVDAEGDGVLL